MIEALERSLRSPHDAVAGKVDAAVAVVLVRRERMRLLFIRKPEFKGYPWSGQIAFPGGRIDPQDRSNLAAALRELEEEIGLPQDGVRVLGSLGIFPSATMKVSVEAFVMEWDGECELQPQESEVAWVAEILLDDCLSHHERAGFAGKAWHTLGLRLQYPVRETVAWGLSARMLHTLLELVNAG